MDFGSNKTLDKINFREFENVFYNVHFLYVLLFLTKKKKNSPLFDLLVNDFRKIFTAFIVL